MRLNPLINTNVKRLKKVRGMRGKLERDNIEVFVIPKKVRIFVGVEAIH